MIKQDEYNVPYCECGDGMTTHKKIGKDGMIVTWYYYCIGCDAWYKLIKLSDVKSELND